MMGGRVSASGGLVLPVGDLEKTASTGFEVAIRTGAGGSTAGWSYRGNFAFTRFSGRDSVRAWQFINYGGDIVHHSSAKYYQFGGFAINQVKRTMREGTSQFGGARSEFESFDFGLSGGVGITVGSGRSPLFAEFGATKVFGDVNDFSWFSVKLGVRL